MTVCLVYRDAYQSDAYYRDALMSLDILCDGSRCGFTDRRRRLLDAIAGKRTVCFLFCCRAGDHWWPLFTFATVVGVAGVNSGPLVAAVPLALPLVVTPRD